MPVTLTNHSKNRIDERSTIITVEQKKLAKQAWDKGFTYSHFTGDFKRYILNKGRRGNKVVIYLGYVFIFASTTRKLITMYEIPETYKKDYQEKMDIVKGKESFYTGIVYSLIGALKGNEVLKNKRIEALKEMARKADLYDKEHEIKEIELDD